MKNISIELSKYMFSPNFAEKIHEFSEKHYKEGLREFRASWSSWISLPEIILFIENEIALLKTQGYTGKIDDIYKKIQISARFYYRKKMKTSKPVNCHNIPRKKAYIGLSQDFINNIDTYIKDALLNAHSKKYINDTVIVKINQKTTFTRFIREHIEEIHMELEILKDKYRATNNEFIPTSIADKFKKAFQNRFHVIRNATYNNQ